MATFTNFIPSFVERYPGASFVSTILLAIGAIFIVRGTGANNTIIQQWDAPIVSHSSGAVTGGQVKAYITSSGTLLASGSLIGRTSLSGGLLNVQSSGAGSGKVSIGGSAGSKICMRKAAGGWAVAQIVGTSWSITAADANTCP